MNPFRLAFWRRKPQLEHLGRIVLADEVMDACKTNRASARAVKAMLDKINVIRRERNGGKVTLFARCPDFDAVDPKQDWPQYSVSFNLCVKDGVAKSVDIHFKRC